MDITDALAPNSDQLDAIELVAPRTFTIAAGGRLAVRDGKTVAEIALEGFPRVWRPSKGMLDVLARCWGSDAKQWVGRRVTLYNDPDVMFGKDRVGGIRVSHLSHIDGEQSVPIRASGRGRAPKPWRVQPLAETPVDPSVVDAAHAAINQATTTVKLDEIAAHATRIGIHNQVKTAIDQRRAELTN
ncbi:hypothetical protein [Microbacterium sp. NPDC055599]